MSELPDDFRAAREVMPEGTGRLVHRLADRLEAAGRERDALKGECADLWEVYGRAVRGWTVARAERDALIDAQVQPWHGGGWVARLEWRSAGYHSGTWQGEGWWHFPTKELAMAAVRDA